MCICLLHCKTFLGAMLQFIVINYLVLPRFYLTFTSCNSFGKIFCHLSVTAVLVSNCI